MEKITEKQTEVETALSEISGCPMSQLDPRVLEVYRGVKEVRPKPLCPGIQQTRWRAPQPLPLPLLSLRVPILTWCRQFCVLAAVCLVSVTEGPREFLSDSLLSSMLRLILGRSFLRTWGVSFLPEMLREGTAFSQS